MSDLDEWVRRATADVQPPPQAMAILDQRMAHFDELARDCKVTIDSTTAVFILYAIVHLSVAQGVSPHQPGHLVAFQDVVGGLAYGLARRHLDAT